MRKSLSSLVLITLAAVMVTTVEFSQCIFAQTQRGTIVGRVTDASGLMIPGVGVELKNLELGVQLDTTTNDEGLYRISSLDYGTYQLTFSLPGFKTHKVTNVLIATATTTTVNAVLEIGEIAAEEVIVEASEVVLERDTSSVGLSIDEKLTKDTPLRVRGAKRTPFDLALVSPATSTAGGDDHIAFAGGRAASQEFLLDGVTTVATPLGSGRSGFLRGGNVPSDGSIMPPIESVGEFKIVFNSAPAEYGRSTGGIITFATKSGTNDFHGALYEYHRNYALDARPWAAAERDKQLQNEFGAAAGGPLTIPNLYDGKGKTFFFTNLTGYRFRTLASTSITTVPTAAMRAGDFSAPDIPPIYDLLDRGTDAQGNTIRNRFPNNQIPESRLSPNSKFWIDQYPPPNIAGAGSLFNYIGTSRTVRDNWDWTLKIDHYLKENHRVSGYYHYSKPVSVTGNILGEEFGVTQFVRQQVLRLDWSHNYTPTTIQQVIYGATRSFWSQQDVNFGQGLGRLSGLTGTLDPECPRISVSEYASFCSGDLTPASTQGRLVQTLNYSLLMNRGKHSIKTGFMWIHFNINTNDRGGVGDQVFSASGKFEFGISRSGILMPLQTADTNNQGGWPFADFYLGLPSLAGVGTPRTRGVRQDYLSTFVQDDWKVTPKLTINAGLRWDLQIPYREIRQQITDLDLDRPNPGAGDFPGALTFYGEGPGRNGINRPGIIWSKAFAPRLGLAYQLDSKTVIRAGGGLTYLPLENGNSLHFNQSGFFGDVAPLRNPDPFGLYYQWDNPFPKELLGDLPNTDPARNNGQSFFYQDRRGLGRPPVHYQYNLGVQRKQGGLLLEASFIANLMRYQHDRNDVNMLAPPFRNLGPLLDLPLEHPTVQAAGFTAPYAGFDTRRALFQALRPFPQYETVGDNAGNYSSGNYHALVLKAQQRFRQGLSFAFHYTISKNLTDSAWAPGAFGTFSRDPYNRRLDKGLATFDVPQRMVLHYSYDLPFGWGRKFMSDAPKVVNAILGGWTVSAYHEYASGHPRRMRAGAGHRIPTVPTMYDRIDDVPVRSSIPCGDLRFGDPQRNYLFNAGTPEQGATQGRPAAYRLAADPTSIGNAPRVDPKARQCGTFNEDVAINKRFEIGERVNVQIGMQAFNLFNRHTWQSSRRVRNTTANFGEIQPVQRYGPRQVQMMVRIEW